MVHAPHKTTGLASLGPMQLLLLLASRSLGALVCVVRGHFFYRPDGWYKASVVYTCVRCGEHDRTYDWRRDLLDRYAFSTVYVDRECALYPRARQIVARWFRFLPYPRWI